MRLYRIPKNTRKATGIDTQRRERHRSSFGPLFGISFAIDSLRRQNAFRLHEQIDDFRQTIHPLVARDT